MKKLILSFLFMLSLPCPANHTTDTQQQYVYICTGKSAYAYHSSPDCRGLNKCNGEVKKVTLEQAQQSHRKPCKICFH